MSSLEPLDTPVYCIHLRSKTMYYTDSFDPRGDEFETVEEPRELARAVRSAQGDAIVVDCLTLWLANVMGDAEETIAAAKEHAAEVICVTNEVGCGIVPENALAREFRDRAGRMNQRFAEAADEAYWMVFGQALRIK